MPIDFDNIRNNRKLYEDVKMVSVDALLGVIPGNLRAYGIGFAETPVFVTIFDKEPSYEEKEDISCAITEVISHIVQPVEEKYLTVPYPESLGPYCPNWGWVYLRKEDQFEINFSHDELQTISKLCLEVVHKIKLNEHQQKMLVHADLGVGTEEKVNQLLNGHPGYRPLFLIEELLFIREAIMVLFANSIEGDVRRFGGTVEDLILVNHRLDQAFLRYSR
ncbi:hypothetical protein [Pseudodesulfovibrio sp.]|uniref:hypothetical protein n=1 Tax=unclassified Pseudodesulfovibrio TaxID=2661612 RepID=UPI003B00828B